MNLTPVQKIIYNNGKKLESEKEISNAVEALLKLYSAQQGVQRIGLLARIIKWFGAIANR